MRTFDIAKEGKMSKRNSGFDSFEGFDMLPDNGTSWFNVSEDSTRKGIQDDRHSSESNASDPDHNMYYASDYYTSFLYQLHDFEEKIYIYIWIFLVILTTFANMLIVVVFVRKSMRTSTNIIFLFIAISDSLTGLVTLPTYIHVFTNGKGGWVSLNEFWCESFMISKFYISKAFHTVSIWQTLLLGFQRFVCVWFPFKVKNWFTLRRTLGAVAIIAICAFVIHTYHLSKNKANKILGACRWAFEHPCVESCAFLWLSVLLLNILPCMILIVLTILMIQKLIRQNIHQRPCHQQIRDQQNRRISVTVVCIVIIFLIPEIPYGIFQLLTVVKKHSDQEGMAFRTNRLFQFIYEIAMLLSFHANFWIYFVIQRQFRNELKSMFQEIVRKSLPKRANVTINTDSTRMSQSETKSTSRTDEKETSTFI